MWWQRQHKVSADPADEYATQASIPREGVDAGLSLEVEDHMWHQVADIEGDESHLSVSLPEDVWHLLTVDLSIGKLLGLEVLLEFGLIFTFALGSFSSRFSRTRCRRASRRGRRFVQAVALADERAAVDGLDLWVEEPRGVDGAIGCPAHPAGMAALSPTLRGVGRHRDQGAAAAAAGGLLP